MTLSTVKSFSLRLFCMSFICLSFSWAAIPRANLILQRTSENAGSGIYQIEQEVQFPQGPDMVSLKETWLIENENNMKVLVTGTKDLKDQIAFYIQISNGQKSGGKKVSEEFIERYFHFRSAESLAQALAQLKLVPGQVMKSRHTRNLKEVDLSTDPFLRLSRTGGVVAYAFGQPATEEKETPGIWIEQDQFVIRKFRLPSDVEVSADRFSSFAKGLVFPRTRVVRWGNNQVTIQTLSVSAKGKETMAQFSLKGSPKMDVLTSLPSAALIEDFYKRFR